MYAHLFYYVVAAFCFLMAAALVALHVLAGSDRNGILLLEAFAFAAFGLLGLYLGWHQNRHTDRKRK